MIELTATPIASADAEDMMRNDAAALLSNHIHCPLASAIEDAVAKLDAAIEACKPQ